MGAGVSRRKTLDWFMEYRSYQILFSHMNAFNSDASLPFTISFLVLSSALSIFIVIRVRTGIQILVVGIVLGTLCFIYVVAFLDLMSKITGTGEKGLASKRNELNKGADRYYKSLMKSCDRLVFRFGSIQSVDKSLVVISAHTIVNIAASLLLATA
jgi:hypothetical protein